MRGGAGQGGSGGRGRPPGGDADDDALLWARAMADVQPLGAPKAAPRRRPKDERAPAAAPAPAAPPEAFGDLLAEHGAFDVEDTGERLLGRAADVDRRVLDRLRRGEFPVDASLDLHGTVRADVARKLLAFLSGARAAGRRAVLVIHGRGLGSEGGRSVLRDAVREALVRPPIAPLVLAFATAPPRDGGPGALLVLLRKP